ncbi:MAG TPA: DUF2726 domain-containing protein [Opitutaceae bacterium]
MHLPVSVYIVLGVMVVFGFFANRAKGRPTKGPVYYARKSLFTPAERSFFGALESLALPGVTITAKVRLEDVFGVVNGLDRSSRQSAKNKISSKHVDFLLLRKGDGKPLLGIELDDSSHQEEGRKARDVFVDTVFAAAALPILRVPAQSGYNPSEIRLAIESAVAGRA